jgi:hypothetical protein
MRSAGSSTPLNLDAGVRTSREDVAALRRARRTAQESLDGYLAFLKGLGHPPAAILRARRGPRGNTPFTL